jgi:hypothetical protein
VPVLVLVPVPVDACRNDPCDISRYEAFPFHLDELASSLRTCVYAFPGLELTVDFIAMIFPSALSVHRSTSEASRREYLPRFSSLSSCS